jgi:tetratricopeptide (TPR) repeat protein
MHDELLAALAKVGELKVISRSSVLSYRDPSQRNLRRIAAELGVSHVLEGSVSRAGNKVRIIVQLVDAASGRQKWAETYPRDVTDIFQLQADLAGKIAQSLSIQLSPELKRGLARKLTIDPRAYDLYLQVQPTEFGTQPSQFRPSPESDDHARKLEEAVRLDPKFAAAWARLSVVYAIEHRYSSAELAPARLEKAKDAIEMALRLDPELAEVRSAYGRYFHLCQGDWARATEQYAIALALKPGDAAVLAYLGLTQRHQGKWAESVVSLERAYALDPRGGNPDHGQWLGALVAQRLYAKAEQVIARFQQRPEAERHRWTSTRAMLRYLRDGDRVRYESTLDSMDLPSTEAGKTGWNYRKAMQSGRYVEAASLYTAPAEGRSERVRGRRYCTAVWLAGDRTAARARAANVLASLPAVEPRQRFDWELLVERATFQAFAGEGNAARESARQAVEAMPVTRSAVEGPTVLARAALVHLVLDEPDRALALLEQALGTPSALLLSSAHPDFEPLWGPLRGNPRYRAALAKWAPRD